MKFFLDMINDLFLIQNVNTPTRGDKILDLVLSSEKALVNDMEISCPIANSDHNIIT